MKLIRCNRLILRRLTVEDGDFLVRLFNEPTWRKNIDDRKVSSTEEARSYIQSHILPRYNAGQLGLLAIELKATATPIGICSLQQRPTLSAPDFGCALLAAYTGHGYAKESVAALLDYARTDLRFDTLYGVVNFGNEKCRRLCESLGFHYAGLIQLAADERWFELFARHLDCSEH